MNIKNKKQFIKYLSEYKDYKVPTSFDTKKDGHQISKHEPYCSDIPVIMRWRHGEVENIIVRICKDGVRSMMVWNNYGSNGYTENALDNYHSWDELEAVEIIE